MADYLNRIDLLLDIADMPAEATKRDILRKIYDFPATAGFTPVFCERGEQSEEVKMREMKLDYIIMDMIVRKKWIGLIK